jgi:hypothetical protein
MHNLIHGKQVFHEQLEQYCYIQDIHTYYDFENSNTKNIIIQNLY